MGLDRFDSGGAYLACVEYSDHLGEVKKVQSTASCQLLHSRYFARRLSGFIASFLLGLVVQKMDRLQSNGRDAQVCDRNPAILDQYGANLLGKVQP